MAAQPPPPAAAAAAAPPPVLTIPTHVEGSDGPSPSTYEEHKAILADKLRDLRTLALLPDSDWVASTVKKCPDIALGSRQYGDFQVIKVSADFEHPPADVFALVTTNDPAIRRQFTPDIIDSKVVQTLGDDVLVILGQVHAPFPVSNRETVISLTWQRPASGGSDAEWLVWGTSVTHASCPVTKSFVRAVTYLMGFTIVPKGPSSCRVTRYTCTDPRGVVPKVLGDMLIQKQAFIITILKQLLSKPKP
eukprot:TRINITY_DN3034_c0_g1_i3.p1 TRINITY_DN3034_c0_g1~~TRINITY_DN3034_c0_g1_i3.p1  ORF type:complete len:248 (+),score=82.21 TRINITY_DN3034_c0_g1_i3:69-812(+)